MHFYVFDQGVPYSHHTFERLQDYASNYYVYSLPKRETPYVYKCNGKSEFIYAFLFPLTNDDRNESLNNRLPPKSIRTVLAVMDLLFTKGEVEDHRAWVPRLAEIYPALYMVTDRGVREGGSLRTSGYSAKKDATLAVAKESGLVNAYLRIANHNRNILNQPILEAFDNAIKTGLFQDDYFQVSIPKWYLEAKAHYGSSDSKDNP